MLHFLDFLSPRILGSLSYDICYFLCSREFLFWRKSPRYWLVSGDRALSRNSWPTDCILQCSKGFVLKGNELESGTQKVHTLLHIYFSNSWS